MSDLDLGNAIEAGAESNFDRGNDSRREIAGHVIRAALPHILDALVAEVEAIEPGGGWGAYGRSVIAGYLSERADLAEEALG